MVPFTLDDMFDCAKRSLKSGCRLADACVSSPMTACPLGACFWSGLKVGVGGVAAGCWAAATGLGTAAMRSRPVGKCTPRCSSLS